MPRFERVASFLWPLVSVAIATTAFSEIALAQGETPSSPIRVRISGYYWAMSADSVVSQPAAIPAPRIVTSKAARAVLLEHTVQTTTNDERHFCYRERCA